MENRLTNRFLFLLSVSLLMLLLSPYLLSYGMFFDGVIYSAVSRNLAVGFGSAWKPAYSLTIGREFYGHPPLGFWMQSAVYRIFGESLWLDKAYTFFIAGVNLILFYLLYRILKGRDDPGFWAPMLVLVSFYSYRWVIRNNLLENTMSTFVLISTILYVMALRYGKVYGALSGFAILFAFLVKGPVGIFPLISPLFLPVKTGGRRRWIVFFIGLSVFILSFLTLLTFPDVRNFFHEYLHRQLEASLLGRENPAPSRFYILYAIATEMAFPLTFLLPLLLTYRKFPEWHGRAVGFLLVALSGSLPIMLSLKQARFYLHPSLFFYSLFLVSLFRPHLRSLERWTPVGRISLALSLVFASISLSVALKFAGTGSGGYVPFYRDFVENPLRLHLPRHEYLSVCPKALYGDWSMFSGMERAFKLSMSLGEGYRYLLVDRLRCRSVPQGYRPVHVGKRFTLYRKVHP